MQAIFTDKDAFKYYGTLKMAKLLRNILLNSKYCLPLYDFVHPANSFATGRTLSTGLMLVKTDETRDCLNYVGLLIHDDYSSCAKRTVHSNEVVKVQQDCVADTEIKFEC